MFHMRVHSITCLPELLPIFDIVPYTAASEPVAKVATTFDGDSAGLLPSYVRVKRSFP